MFFILFLFISLFKSVTAVPVSFEKAASTSSNQTTFFFHGATNIDQVLDLGVEIDGSILHVDAVIGTGSIATVFRTKEPKPAALKVFDIQKKEAQSQFNHEVDVLQAVDRLLGITDISDPLPAIKMILIKGTTFIDMLMSNQLTVDLLDQIRVKGHEALERLHERGVVHRDIHPGNFIVRMSSESVDRVRFIDFGRAELFDEVDESTQKLLDRDAQTLELWIETAKRALSLKLNEQQFYQLGQMIWDEEFS